MLEPRLPSARGSLPQFPGSGAQLQSAIAEAFDPGALELILLPTEKCQLRCTYCYEDFAIGKMQPGIIQGIKKLAALRMPELRRFRLAWFGGEPLLALDTILDVSNHCQELAARYSVAFHGSATTNGLLMTPTCVEQLVAAGVTDYQITLDGPREHHDKLRITSSGGRTFDSIWDNLGWMRRSSLGITVTLRVHLSVSNKRALPDFVALLDKEFLEDSRFGLLLAPVEHLGGAKDSTFSVLSTSETVELIRELRSRSRFGQALQATSTFAPYVCYASKPNSLLIRADGRLGKCTVAFSDERNSIGRILETGELEVNQERYRSWLHGWESGDVAALGCPLGSMGQPVEQAQR